MKALEQATHVGITVKVEVLEGVAVSREECLDAQRCPGVWRSNEQRVANPLRHQLDPSIDQRFHQDLAHLSVGLNEGVHLVPCQLDGFAGVADAKTHQRWATEDHADVTSELFGVNGRNQDVAQGRGPDDLYLTGLDDEERHAGLAAFDQDVAARDGTNHSARGDPRDLRGTQRRKHECRVGGAREQRRARDLMRHRHTPWTTGATGTSTRPTSPSSVTR